MDKLPLIVDIKRGSLEDGPGIRSVVFFKGCPLHCFFCHSPETQDYEVEIAFSPRECVQCDECVKVCSRNAIDPGIPGRIHRDRCDRCGRCTEVCPGRGLRLIGYSYSIEELTEILLKDLPFYRHSGGGVTISGGECTLYPDYLESLLRGLKTEGIHIVLETSGHFSYRTFREKILPYVDVIYYDIKIADPEAHKKFLGKSNQIIIENLNHLLKENNVEIHPRIPIIPEITATRENLAAIVNLVCNMGAKNISLLPYNPMGLAMAENLGKSIPSLPKTFMKPHDEQEVYDRFKTIILEKQNASLLVS